MWRGGSVRDVLVSARIAAHGMRGTQVKRQRRAREAADLTLLGRMRTMGLEPDDYAIGLHEAARILGRPISTVHRWVVRGLWGLGVGEGTQRVGSTLVTSRDALAQAMQAMAQMHEHRRQRQAHETPAPTINSALAALIAAVDASDEPVTLHQVGIATGGAYAPGELAAAALKAVRSHQLERERVESRTGIGPAKVWAYSPGPAFAVAKSRRPRVIARLKAESFTQVRNPAYAPES